MKVVAAASMSASAFALAFAKLAATSAVFVRPVTAASKLVCAVRTSSRPASVFPTLPVALIAVTLAFLIVAAASVPYNAGS